MTEVIPSTICYAAVQVRVGLLHLMFPFDDTRSLDVRRTILHRKMGRKVGRYQPWTPLHLPS